MSSLASTHVHECPTCGYRALVRRKTVRGFLVGLAGGIVSGVRGVSQPKSPRDVVDADTGPRLFLLPFGCLQCGTRNFKHVAVRALAPFVAMVALEALAIAITRRPGATPWMAAVHGLALLPMLGLVARLSRSDITLIRRLPDAIPSATARLSSP